MNYATWKLNFTDPNYGTGPEQAILEQGITASGSWVLGIAEQGGTILGYLSAEVDESKLTDWQVRNITQAEALAFCQTINSDAYILDSGIIVAPEPIEL